MLCNLPLARRTVPPCVASSKITLCHVTVTEKEHEAILAEKLPVVFEHVVFASCLMCNFTSGERQAPRSGIHSPCVILSLITGSIRLAVLVLKIDNALQISLSFLNILY